LRRSVACACVHFAMSGPNQLAPIFILSGDSYLTARSEQGPLRHLMHRGRARSVPKGQQLLLLGRIAVRLNESTGPAGKVPTPAASSLRMPDIRPHSCSPSRCRALVGPLSPKFDRFPRAITKRCFIVWNKQRAVLDGVRGG
jgi:hypothetical protein